MRPFPGDRTHIRYPPAVHRDSEVTTRPSRLRPRVTLDAWTMGLLVPDSRRLLGFFSYPDGNN